MLEQAGIAFTAEERVRLRWADFGLNDLAHIGLEMSST